MLVSHSHRDFTAWSSLVRSRCFFKLNSASARKAFSLMNDVFSVQQDSALGDYLKAAVIQTQYYKEIVRQCNDQVYKKRDFRSQLEAILNA